MVRSIISVVMLCLMAQVVSAAQNTINSVRVSPDTSKTRIVFDVDSAPDFTYFTLKKPLRVVIDFKNTANTFKLSTVENNGSLIRKLRYSTPKRASSARVVVELNRNAEPSLFAVAPNKSYGHRLVLDLADSSPGVTRQSSASSISTTSDRQVIIDESSSTRDRDIIVAIDAGHGGQDPGSIGPAGTFEKHITLSIAKRLQAMVDAEKGMRAIMTRSGDYYLSPNKRPEIARQKKADLLISIHADAFTQPQPRGGSVWVLSMRRAATQLWCIGWRDSSGR